VDLSTENQSENLGIQHWLNLIAAYDKEFTSWEKRVSEIQERYTDKKAKTRKTARFNILWSNVQTLKPAIFARLPKPDVSRRFRDNDPVGRVAALLLERALSFEIEHYPDYKSAMECSVLDRLLGARGVSWVRYEPEFGQPEEITEDQKTPTEVIKNEKTPVDYVHWRDFGHAVCRTWEEVPTLWRKVYMDRQALIARFGEDLGTKIPLDTRPEELKKSSYGSDAPYNAQACIYEIWHKPTQEALWISKSMPQILDRKPDPLGLEGFWPCAKPLYGTLTNDSLIPTPDFCLYQDQAEELDILADRIEGLTKALQVKGVHDAAIPELQRLFTEGTNLDLIPVKNWAAFAEKQGLDGSIQLVDLKPIFEALTAAYEATEAAKNIIYEISGLPDIIRGVNDPASTATAEKSKGQFGSLRLRDKQKEVAEFAAELLRIKAQIICSKYQPETIIRIGGADQLTDADKPYVMPAIQLLKSPSLSAFRIDVEADSLVQLDEDMEKANRMEFLGAVGDFFAKAIQAPPELAPLLGTLLKYGVTGFKVGKLVEGEIDAAVDLLKQQAANPQQKPDPEMVKVQGQMELEKFKAQNQQQMDAARLQMEDAFREREAQRAAAVEQAKQQAQHEQLVAQNQLEAQRAEFEARLNALAEEQKRQNDAQIELIKQQFAVLMKKMDNAAKIEVAEIQAQTTLDAAQISSANQAEKSA